MSVGLFWRLQAIGAGLVFVMTLVTSDITNGIVLAVVVFLGLFLVDAVINVRRAWRDFMSGRPVRVAAAPAVPVDADDEDE